MVQVVTPAQNTVSLIGSYSPLSRDVPDMRLFMIEGVVARAVSSPEHDLGHRLRLAVNLGAARAVRPPA